VQIAGGAWIVDAMTAAAPRPAARGDAVKPVRPVVRPEAWTPPPAQGRGLLIDLLV
jgi:hypothetical protein